MLIYASHQDIWGSGSIGPLTLISTLDDENGQCHTLTTLLLWKELMVPIG